VNGLLSNAILEVCIYATKGELLLHIVAGLLEGIVVKLPIVAVVMLDPDAMFCGILFKGLFDGDCFCRCIVNLEVDEV
jgi:hypothetical protein